jgi:hypothetical protein
MMYRFALDTQGYNPLYSVPEKAISHHLTSPKAKSENAKSEIAGSESRPPMPDWCADNFPDLGKGVFLSMKKAILRMKGRILLDK